jgi:ABC-type Mn2+/Zn2+ transport system ATPase subunit
MSAPVTFDNVTLGYRRHVVLSGLSFAIRKGEFFGIVGANGSGKTTILRVLLGLLPPMSGKVIYELSEQDGTGDQRIEQHAGAVPMRFGYVPQRQTLDDAFPLSTREVVLMGRYGLLGLMQPPGAHDHEMVERAMELTGIGDAGDKPFRDLSGGQRQRALIARAVTSEARVLVLDEPTDGMDIEGQRGIMELISRLQRESGVTIIYVTHRLNELSNSAQRLLLLHGGHYRLGTCEQILTGEVLSAVYGIAVRVETIAGKRMVIT